MKGTFIIQFTTEARSQKETEKEVHILGAYHDSELAYNYIKKFYNHDVTNGDTNIKVVDEFIKITERKNGEIECYVKKVYEHLSITYIEEMETVVLEELTEKSNPMKDILSCYN